LTRELATATALVLAAAPAPERFVQPRDADGRFLNLDGSGAKGLRDLFRWQIVDRLAGRRRRTPKRAAIPTMRPDLARIARPPARGEGIRLTWIGHASWLVQMDGASLLVDPVLSERLPGLVRRNVASPLSFEQLPHVDAVLISHSHYDHLDLPTLTRVRAPVVAGLGIGKLLRKEGLAVATVGWWQSVHVGELTITFVPAQHWSRRSLGDTNATLWGGFVVEGPSGAVYHCGDSGWFEGFAQIGRRFPSIDVALLPIGAYDPRWFMSPQHMDPEEAVRAFEALGARRMLAMHWGTFKLTDEPLDEPPRRLEAERLRRGLAADRVRALAIGETVELPPRVGDRAEAPAAP
jgi:L-ascorbate metabolism protein UlaG (beta-lactamase superfamily)